MQSFAVAESICTHHTFAKVPQLLCVYQKLLVDQTRPIKVNIFFLLLINVLVLVIIFIESHLIHERYDLRESVSMMAIT